MSSPSLEPQNYERVLDLSFARVVRPGSPYRWYALVLWRGSGTSMHGKTLGDALWSAVKVCVSLHRQRRRLARGRAP